ncbi:MAG TPA: hypothetical protein VFX89_14460 [Gammaproteobacteria bacterium]|nr:hypothetical protein [Gammaproteobacteria bacterium]
MRRALALLMVVAAAGGLLVYRARGPAPPAPVAADSKQAAPRASAATPAPAPASRERELFRLLGPGFGAEQRTAVDALAAGEGRAELEALVRAVAGLPDVPGVRYTREALLERYAAIDLAAAVALARDVDAPADLVAALHADWARADPQAALRALDAYDPARAARVALELLQVIGDDDEAVARLLAAAPRVDANRLRADAAVARAAHDLTGALRAVADLSGARRRDAVARIAERAAGDDARAALGAAARLDRETAEEFSGAVLREWAKRDPEAMLYYALSLDPDSQRAAIEGAGLEAFAQLPPARVIAILDRLPADVAREVRQVELLGLGRTDPLAAIRYAEAQPPGPERSRALELAARGYVLADPVAALAWVQSLRPPEPGLLASAIAGFARVDPDRAIDLLLADTSGRRVELARQLVTGGALDPEHVAALVSRWPSTPAGRAELRTLVGGWARRDPEGAVEWLIANDERFARDAYASAAEALGRNDPDAAESYLRRVPAEIRPTWIKSAADGYARQDPQRAAAWAAQHAGEDGYEGAVGTIARRWNALDSAAAREWALSLSPGDARDAALSPLLSTAVGARGDVDSALLGAFSSNAAQQYALANGVVLLVRRDPAAARRIADRYLTDPEERERAIGVRP